MTNNESNKSMVKEANFSEELGHILCKDFEPFNVAKNKLLKIVENWESQELGKAFAPDGSKSNCPFSCQKVGIMVGKGSGQIRDLWLNISNKQKDITPLEVLTQIWAPLSKEELERIAQEKARKEALEEFGRNWLKMFAKFVKRDANMSDVQDDLDLTTEQKEVICSLL